MSNDAAANSAAVFGMSAPVRMLESEPSVCSLIEIKQACQGTIMQDVLGLYELVQRPTCDDSIDTSYPVYRSRKAGEVQQEEAWDWIFVKDGNGGEDTSVWTVLHLSPECVEEDAEGDFIASASNPHLDTSSEISCYNGFQENSAVENDPVATDLVIVCADGSGATATAVHSVLFALLGLWFASSVPSLC